MATHTLDSLIARVAFSSAELITPSSRASTSMVAALLNSELEQYHAEMADHSEQLVKRALLTTSASTTVGADGWPANERVELPEDFMMLKGANVNDGSRWFRMRRISESQRPDDSVVPGVPSSFMVVGSADATTTLRLVPPANAAYSIEVIYLPKFTELSDGVTLLPGGDDWLVEGTALRVLQNTGVQEPAAFQAARDRYVAAQQRVKRFASKMDRSGPRAMRETDRDQLPGNYRYRF